MSEESHTTKQAFLMFGDALRVMNSTQQRTNALLESVVDQLKSIDRRDQEIIQRMDAAAERASAIERRIADGERKSDGKIKVLERRLDNHEEQLATLRKAAFKTQG
jgi:predicted  nucleic acid-binding Zn-ribbon protein